MYFRFTLSQPTYDIGAIFLPLKYTPIDLIELDLPFLWYILTPVLQAVFHPNSFKINYTGNKIDLNLMKG